MVDVAVDIDFTALTPTGIFRDYAGLKPGVPFFNEQPFELFHYTTDGDGATDPEFACARLSEVVDGFIYNVTDDAWVTTIYVQPKSGTPTTAVAKGTLGNSKVYLIFVAGVRATR